MGDRVTDRIQQWRKEVQDGSLPPVVLLVGQSDLLLRKAIEIVSEHLFRKGGRDLNYHPFPGESSRPADWLTAARSAPMLASRRLVVATGIESWIKKDSAEDTGLAALAEYARNDKPRGQILLTVGDIPAKSWLGEQLRQAGAVAPFDFADRPSDVQEFIRQAFRRRGISIDPGAVTALADALGASPEAIAAEVEKLAEYAGSAKIITTQDVEEMVQRLQGHDVFDLNRALVQKDVRKALTILERMYNNLLESKKKVAASGLPLFLLSSCFEFELRRMAVAKKYEATMDVPGLAAALKCKDTAASIILSNSRRFSEAELVAALDKVRDVDRRLKSTNISSKLLLEDLILTICLAGRKR